MYGIPQVKVQANDNDKENNMKPKMAKGRPRKFDTEQALDIALKLFWTHGYEGVSISMLADALGINVPSLYSAFGNKESLFIKTVERYTQLNSALYYNAVKEPTSYEVVKSILEGEVELVTQQDCPHGCMMIQGALVTSPAAESIREMMIDMRRMGEEWLAERFQKAKDEGDLPPQSDPAILACYVMVINSGLAIQAKSGVPREKLLQIVDIAMKAWPLI